MAREGATSFRGRGEIPSKAISLQLFWKPSTDPNKLSLSPSLAQFPQIS